MSDQQTWVEALNIDPKMLAEWSQQAPSGKPILVHCLESGLVEYGDYMRWAQNHFGLAVLQPHFFQGTFDPAQLEQEKAQADWHPWIFPVERWEGVTFVACVEPPRERADGVRYVLADPRAMRDAWGATSTSLPALPEMPEGLSTAPKPFKLDLHDTTFNFGQAPEAPPVAVTEPGPELEATGIKLKPELKVVPALPEEETAPPPPIPVSAPAAAKAKVSVDEGTAIEELFASLDQKFQSALIMKCSEQTAKLYRHDARIHPSGDNSKTTINLSYPTFMRIVTKTGLPYHGYLVDSPAHAEFFKALGFEKTPGCVTAIPIRFDNFIWGFIVATGSHEHQKMEFLSFAQEATERLMQAVGADWSKAA